MFSLRLRCSPMPGQRTSRPGSAGSLDATSAAMRNRHQGSAGGERSTRAHTDSYVKKQMNAALYYLPVMVAFTTATKFNCNKLVSVALAAAMIHPSVSALLATEGGAYFLGIKLQNIAYGGQVCR